MQIHFHIHDARRSEDRTEEITVSLLLTTLVLLNSSILKHQEWSLKFLDIARSLLMIIACLLALVIKTEIELSRTGSHRVLGLLLLDDTISIGLFQSTLPYQMAGSICAISP